jgi:hypothetical protein
MVKTKFEISKDSQIFERVGVFLCSLYAKPSLLFFLRRKYSGLINSEFYEDGVAQTMNGIDQTEVRNYHPWTSFIEICH